MATQIQHLSIIPSMSLSQSQFIIPVCAFGGWWHTGITYRIECWEYHFPARTVSECGIFVLQRHFLQLRLDTSMLLIVSIDLQAWPTFNKLDWAWFCQTSYNQACIKWAWFSLINRQAWSFFGGYRQTFGTAMGSPLSATVTNLVM